MLLMAIVACKSPNKQQEQATNKTVKAEGFIALPQTKLYYRTIGTGEPLIILHGGPGMDQSYLLPQMEILKKDHQLIFFDQRTCGKSSFEMDSSLVSMAQFVEDIEAVRKHFQLERINLMGHSWGGLLAMWYAKTYPEKLKSLMLLNSIGASTAYTQQAQENMQSKFTPEEQLHMQALMQSDAFQAQEDSVLLAVFRMSFAAIFFNRDKVKELNLSLPDHRVERQAKLRFLMGDLADYDLHEELKQVKAPTLIIHGDYDATPVDAMMDIADVMPNARLEVVKESGHFVFIEQPELFRELVEGFLDDVRKE